MGSLGGELATSLLRIPIDRIKQRMQLGSSPSTCPALEKRIYWSIYAVTVMRDIPFSLIQYPMYESLKGAHWLGCTGSLQAAFAGAIGGAVAAATTAPLDLLRTKFINQNSPIEKNLFRAIRQTARIEGLMSLFSGLQYRILWISTGDFIFLGSYEYFLRRLSQESQSDGAIA